VHPTNPRYYGPLPVVLVRRVFSIGPASLYAARSPMRPLARCQSLNRGFVIHLGHESLESALETFAQIAPLAVEDHDAKITALTRE
jgi:hypothetical protein